VESGFPTITEPPPDHDHFPHESLGSLVAGAAITALSRHVIPWLFVVTALGYLPIAWALFRARTVARACEQAQAAQRPRSTAFPVALLLKASLAVSLFQFGV
jgi:uncharacterized membrane protein